MTYVEGEVETENIAFLEKGIEIDILGLARSLLLRCETVTIVIADLHVKGGSLLRHVASDTAHA